MNPMENNDDLMFKEKVLVDFHYFIQSAIEKKLAWNTLAYFLTDLAPTLEKSRQVIKILVQELEKWVLKVDIEGDSFFTENVTEDLYKELAEHVQDEYQNTLASSELSDSEDDILEVTNDDPGINADQLDQNDQELNLIENKEILGERDILLDKVGNQFYEFVGDQKDSTDDYDIPKVESMDEFENNDQVLKQIESKEKDSEVIGDDEGVINVEDKIGDQFYEFVGEPEETPETHKISKETEGSMDAEEKVSLNEPKESKISNLVPNPQDFLVRHQRHNMGDTLYKCNKCTKTFTTKFSLRRHEIIHTGQKPFQCTTCSKTFNAQSNLKTHIMFHKGTFPYHCQTCGKGVVSPYQLSIHERIHTGEKPYECKTCSRSFTLKSDLKNHQIIHTNEKPFQCNTCKKCFNQRQTLKRHEIIHTNEKPYQCNTCKKCFNLRHVLKRHEKIHT